MAQDKEANTYTSTAEQPSSGEFYLYDPDVITELRKEVGDRPVVVFNGMNTIYAPAEDNPDGERVPFEEVQKTIKAIREQIPDVFIVGWTGKGPRSNVEKAISDTAHLVIGEENLKPPTGQLDEKTQIDYSKVVRSATWLTPDQKQDLIAHGPSPSIKDPQLFARGPIVIIDNDKNIGENKPGKNNSSITFISSNMWAKSRILPHNLATTVIQSLRPRSNRRMRLKI